MTSDPNAVPADAIRKMLVWAETAAEEQLDAAARQLDPEGIGVHTGAVYAYREAARRLQKLLK